MSDVERLTAELELAKLSEKLEAARERMHADRSPERINAYKKAAQKVADARSAFRLTYQVEVSPGDAAPQVDTVQAKAQVNG